MFFFYLHFLWFPREQFNDLKERRTKSGTFRRQRFECVRFVADPNKNSDLAGFNGLAFFELLYRDTCWRGSVQRGRTRSLLGPLGGGLWALLTVILVGLCFTKGWWKPCIHREANTLSSTIVYNNKSHMITALQRLRPVMQHRHISPDISARTSIFRSTFNGTVPQVWMCVSYTFGCHFFHHYNLNCNLFQSLPSLDDYTHVLCLNIKGEGSI